MKKILILINLLIFSSLLFAQTENITVAFYNVENLFDTINDPQIKDDEFTPEGEKHWTNERYHKKLNDIAKVVNSINKNQIPDIIGFAEVENKLVLEDLIKTEYLNSKKYEIIHEESPDVRGIDVALIYNPDKFKYVNHQKIPIPLDTEYKVRDILYVKGILLDTDTLHIFVNHWKSRSGGHEQTEPQRVQCALTLKNVIDSVKVINPDAHILIMGDFNDTPSNTSIYNTLKADNTKTEESLYNLMLPLSKEGVGTNSYRNKWYLLDQIIVSNNMIGDTSVIIVKDKKGYIFNPEWITFTNNQGNKSPNRTYGGPNYYGGYSDHYPVYTIITKQ